MYGITKTLVGYFAASVSMRFDVESVGHPACPELLLLLLPCFLLLDHAAGAAGADGSLRSTGDVCTRGTEFGRGDPVVPDSGPHEACELGVSCAHRDIELCWMLRNGYRVPTTPNSRTS